MRDTNDRTDAEFQFRRHCVIQVLEQAICTCGFCERIRSKRILFGAKRTNICAYQLHVGCWRVGPDKIWKCDAKNVGFTSIEMSLWTARHFSFVDRLTRRSQAYWYRWVSFTIRWFGCTSNKRRIKCQICKWILCRKRYQIDGSRAQTLSLTLSVWWKSMRSNKNIVNNWILNAFTFELLNGAFSESNSLDLCIVRKWLIYFVRIITVIVSSGRRQHVMARRAWWCSILISVHYWEDW